MKAVKILVGIVVVIAIGFLIFLGAPFLYMFKIFIEALVLEVLHKDVLLYRYDNTPCEGKTFVINKEMILLENKTRSAMSYKLYPISRYSLDDYEEHRRFHNIKFDADEDMVDMPRYTFNKEIKFYDINTTFLIKKAYGSINKVAFGSSSTYYLVKTPENILAWISTSELNEKCQQRSDNKYHSLYKDFDDYKNVKKTLIPYEEPPKAFSDNEEVVCGKQSSW